MEIVHHCALEDEFKRKKEVFEANNISSEFIFAYHGTFTTAMDGTFWNNFQITKAKTK